MFRSKFSQQARITYHMELRELQWLARGQLHGLKAAVCYSKSSLAGAKAHGKVPRAHSPHTHSDFVMLVTLLRIGVPFQRVELSCSPAVVS